MCRCSMSQYDPGQAHHAGRVCVRIHMRIRASRRGPAGPPPPPPPHTGARATTQRAPAALFATCRVHLPRGLFGWSALFLSRPNTSGAPSFLSLMAERDPPPADGELEAPTPPPFSEQQLTWLQTQFGHAGAPTPPPPTGVGETRGGHPHAILRVCISRGPART